MRISIMTGTVLLSLAASWLVAGENVPPPLAPDAAWTVDKSNTLAYPDWLQKPDLFICHGLDVSPWKERFARQIQTEDPQLNALIESLYDRCVWGALREPRPPALPNRWITGGGGYVGQWLWGAMFVATAFAPLDDDPTIRGVFENYW